MSKIISPETKPESPAPATPRATLTPQGFSEIAGAIHRLRELENFSVLSPTTEAELRGTKDFLSRAFMEHAEEFLGAWHTVKFEYSPILKTIASLAHRVGAIVHASQQPAPATEETTPAQ